MTGTRLVFPWQVGLHEGAQSGELVAPLRIERSAIFQIRRDHPGGPERQPMTQADAWRMVPRRAEAVGIKAPIGRKSFSTHVYIAGCSPPCCENPDFCNRIGPLKTLRIFCPEVRCRVARVRPKPKKCRYLSVQPSLVEAVAMRLTTEVIQDTIDQAKMQNG